VISAALAVLTGMVLLARPAALTLTIVLGAYFPAEGVATIMYALEHRRELTARWSWLVICGLVDMLISFLVITGLPSSAEWAIGILVGSTSVRRHLACGAQQQNLIAALAHPPCFFWRVTSPKCCAIEPP
jgi:uncharacterized membrane protein HdeD (DUF308 family)